MTLADGTILSGDYEEPLGSLMFFDTPASGQAAVYRGHSESVLMMNASQPQASGRLGQQVQEPNRSKTLQSGGASLNPVHGPTLAGGLPEEAVTAASDVNSMAE
eukprot:360465-Chlamydomonas_euryale.AAC.8